MRAVVLPALALMLTMAAVPLQAQTTPDTTAESVDETGANGPKFVRPEVITAQPDLTTGVNPAATLAEEILSAATLTDQGSAAEPEPVPVVAEEPALSEEVVLAIATSAVNRAATLVADLTRETIEVRVSISQQMMEVWYKGEMIHEWPVSTARKGKITPKGSYKPQWLSKNHKSSLYNNAPMPYSIFYSGHYAIHGTDQESKLGRPASAGCVRLSRANAKILFAMVQQEGKSKMKVEILD